MQLAQIIVELELNNIEDIFNIFRDIQKDFDTLSDI